MGLVLGIGIKTSFFKKRNGIEQYVSVEKNNTLTLYTIVHKQGKTVKVWGDVINETNKVDADDIAKERKNEAKLFYKSL